MCKTGHLLIIILLFFSQFLYCDTDLNNLLDETGSSLKWEPYRKIGVIVKGNNQLIFKPGIPWIIINYKEKVFTGDIWFDDRGSILFSETAAEAVRGFLKKVDRSMPLISTVIIDPGHGGRDPGTIGKFVINDNLFELQEKDIVLKVSLALYRMLKDRYPDKNIILTRNNDTYLKLEERTEIANAVKLAENEALIFISIHANASLNSKASGFEVWYLPPEYRRDLIDTDSMTDITEDVIPILNTMLEEEYTVESIILAQDILAGLEDEIGGLSENRGLKEESWFVVRRVKAPSVLIELGFVTNQEEALRLNTDDHLKELAQGLYTGIKNFIGNFEETKGFTE